MLTIISGKFKGHKIICPKSGTRPTKSMVKKALFDTIRPDLEEAIFCDLFAGSGAVGLEALSQGAKFCYFNEASKEALNCLKKNISSLKCEQTSAVSIKKASKFLDVHQDLCQKIDIFFIDPPYDISKDDPSSYEALLDFFNKTPLKNNVLIICESQDPQRIEKPLENLEALYLENKKSYGDSILFYIKKG